MPAQLVALRDGPNILIDKPILLLGRHPECDIQIDSRKISRRHCVIAQINDYLLVRDLDSTNGIRINGIKVVEGKLMPGDELTVGNHVFRVQIEDNSYSAAGGPKSNVSSPSNPEEDELEDADEPIPLLDLDKNRPNRPRPRPHTDLDDSAPLG